MVRVNAVAMVAKLVTVIELMSGRDGRSEDRVAIAVRLRSPARALGEIMGREATPTTR